MHEATTNLFYLNFLKLANCPTIGYLDSGSQSNEGEGVRTIAEIFGKFKSEEKILFIL